MNFKLWLLVLESGRFDRQGFNALFRRQLEELLPKVTDEPRRESLEAMRGVDFVNYILTSLRNPGLADERDREEAAHDVVVQLLVQPGKLFTGYDAASGAMQARFALSVRNVLRSRRRREPMNRAIGAVDAVPDRLHQDVDDEVLAAFMSFLKTEVGEDAVRLLTVKVNDDLSQRDFIRHPEFRDMGKWRIRRLMAQIKDAARAFAARQGDDAILAAINRLTARQDEWSSPWWWLAA